MSTPKLEDLLQAGCHFGHLASRWNPKMKPYIFMEKNGVHVIDLKKTQQKLDAACKAISDIAANGESILFVGTKKQAQEIIRGEAERSNNFYVVERWLGGQLTNFATVKRSVRKWKSLEKKATDGTYEKITKKEKLDIERQKEKMEKVLGGIADMKRIPGAIFVVDILREHIAVQEAKKLGVPVFGIVDTNADPDRVDYAIPANDDASKSISVISKAITDAFLEGASKVKAKKTEDENSSADPAKKIVRRARKAKPKAEDVATETVADAPVAEAAEAPAADAKPAKKAPAKTVEKETAAKTTKKSSKTAADQSAE